MGTFTLKDTGIDDLLEIECKSFSDNRGSFAETWNDRDFKEIGINETFVQDNQSISSYGVIRGLHFQKQYPQAKLVRVSYGKAFDVAVDLRKSSKTFGRWYGLILTGTNNKMLYIPKGFAHGFLSLSEKTVFTYKCSDFYHPNDEGGIIWNDPTLNIAWPIPEDLYSEKTSSESDISKNLPKITISEKDSKYPKFKEIIKDLPY